MATSVPDGKDVASVDDPTVDKLQDSAASYTLPEVINGTGGDLSVYQLKWVEWEGGFSPVVIQNENGPCPLLALCNVLILSGRMKIPPGETIVTSTNLLNLLGACLIESRSSVHLTAGERANYEQNMQDAMAVFPNLQTGLDVNVKFDSVSGFEFTSESGLFDLFDVALYHGWLVDPQDKEACEVVSQYSYNQLVEMVINNSHSNDVDKLKNAVIAENFLTTTASQLTYHGLCELNNVVTEGQLCVFFRNNHFSTLYKHKDQLLILVTDYGFLTELDHVWETLVDIDGGGDFLDAHFRWTSPSESQRKSEEASKDSKDTVAEHTENASVDEHDPNRQNIEVQTTLGLQQDQGTAADHQSQENTAHLMQQADAELAAQLYVEELEQEQQRSSPPPSHPPSSLEEYQRAAARDEQLAQKRYCTLM